MNHKLIDTVSDILRYHGIVVLSESKFWYILTDTYSFASDYSLRDTFRRCISKGYPIEIANLKGDRRSTVLRIAEIIKLENFSNPIKRDELKTVLYSIAIGVGTCDNNDYINHDVVLSEKSDLDDMSKNSSADTLTADDEVHLSDKQACIALLYFLGGLLFSLGGVFLYKFLYDGEYELSLGGIVFMVGLSQFIFSALIGALVFSAETETTVGVDEHFRTVMLSFLFPIFVSFLLNAFFSLLFFNHAFVVWLGEHIYGSGIEIPDISANLFNFFLSFAYFISVSIGFLKCYDSSLSGELTVDVLFDMHKEIDSKIVVVSSVIVIFFYAILFFYPIIMNTPL